MGTCGGILNGSTIFAFCMYQVWGNMYLFCRAGSSLHLARAYAHSPSVECVFFSWAVRGTEGKRDPVRPRSWGRVFKSVKRGWTCHWYKGQPRAGRFARAEVACFPLNRTRGGARIGSSRLERRRSWPERRLDQRIWSLQSISYLTRSKTHRCWTRHATA